MCKNKSHWKLRTYFEPAAASQYTYRQYKYRTYFEQLLEQAVQYTYKSISIGPILNLLEQAVQYTYRQYKYRTYFEPARASCTVYIQTI